MNPHLFKDVIELDLHEKYLEHFNYSITGCALRDKFIQNDIDRIEYTHLYILNIKINEWLTWYFEEIKIDGKPRKDPRNEFLLLFEIEEERKTLNILKVFVRRVLGVEDKRKTFKQMEDSLDVEINWLIEHCIPIREFVMDLKSIEGKENAHRIEEVMLETFKYHKDHSLKGTGDYPKDYISLLEECIEAISELIGVHYVYLFKSHVDAYFDRKVDILHDELNGITSSKPFIDFVYHFYVRKTMTHEVILENVDNIGGEFRRCRCWCNRWTRRYDDKLPRCDPRTWSFRATRRWIWRILMINGKLEEKLPAIVGFIILYCTYIYMDEIKIIFSKYGKIWSEDGELDHAQVTNDFQKFGIVTGLALSIIFPLVLIPYIYTRWPRINCHNRRGRPFIDFQTAELVRRNDIRFAKNMSQDLIHDPAAYDHRYDVDYAVDDMEVMTLFFHLEEKADHLERQRNVHHLQVHLHYKPIQAVYPQRSLEDKKRN